MIYAVIDIGSNSVRVMFSDGEKTLEKIVKTTRLAEGMGERYELQTVAIDRTVAAVSFFVQQARCRKIENIYIFATAAVRRAVNKKVFIDAVYEKCGILLDVVSGEREAEIGYIGALDGKDGAIIDVGGASTEINVVKNGNKIYSKSIDVGAVTLTDKFGQNAERVEGYLSEKIKEFGDVPQSEFLSIGGTATSVAAMLLQLETYDANKVHGFSVRKDQLINLENKLFSLSVEERKNIKGLHPDRAKVIACGVAILRAVMEKTQINNIIVSEKDNLEGYLRVKTNGEKNYE